MKALKFFLIALLAAITIPVMAQTKTVRMTTTNYSIFDFGYSTTYTGTLGTAVNADTITVAANEGGLLRVTCVGYSDDSTSSVTGSKIVRYNKVAGTLTLGSPSNILAVAADTKITTATFSVAAVSNNICVTVTGVAGVTIRWKIIIEQLKIPKSS